MLNRMRYLYGLLRGVASATQPWSREARVKARRKLALEFLDGEARCVTFQRDSTWWTVFLNDIVGKDLFLTGQFHSHSMDAALNWLAASSPEWPSRPWIVNVGGNIGDTCVQLCKRETKRVLVCEPVPDTFRLLAQNVEMNELGARVKYRQVAIGDEDGDVEMAVTRDSGWSEVRASDGREGFTLLEEAKRYIKVPTLTLNSLIASESLRPEDVSLVWSDTQGFEAQVIRGGAGLWATGVPLWAEFWPAGLAAHGGIPSFIREAQAHFRGFISETALTGAAPGAQPALQPIAELPAFADQVATMQATDLLLVP